MSDVLWRSRTPLDGEASPGRFGATAPASGVVVAEVAGRGLATVMARKGQGAAAAAAALAAFGLELPTTPRHVARDGLGFVWAGPERWLAIFDAEPAGGVEAALAPVFGRSASVVDQTDARLLLRVAGPRARDALAKGVPVDLDGGVFRPGDVALTMAGHLDAQLWLVDDAPTFELTVARSFAGSFWHWLTRSCAEFGYDVDIRSAR